jgi:hypothetical protein
MVCCIKSLMGPALAILLLMAGNLGDRLTGSAQAAETASPGEHLEEIAPEISREALSQIPDTGRRLLALRSYIRAGKGLVARWSWTVDQIAAYQGSPEQHALLAEIEAVRTHFSTANPGYTLYVNTKVRSLDDQIRSWNTNGSVGTSGAEILDAWLKKFGGDEPLPDAGSLNARRVWLSSFSSSKRANVAAPGLTLHGQARAIDFQIMKDGRIIASADSRQIETLWRAEQWDTKLNASIVAAGPSFTGPLRSPDEPWHYDYVPTTAILAISARAR